MFNLEKELLEESDKYSLKKYSKKNIDYGTGPICIS